MAGVLSVGRSLPSVLCCTLYLSFARGADRGDGGLDDPPTIMMAYREASPDRLDTFPRADEADTGAQSSVHANVVAGVVDEQCAGLGVRPLDHDGARRPRTGVLRH